MARPRAASPAATVRMNSAKTGPTRAWRNDENATKLMLTASRMSSIDIRMMITFFRFRKMPTTPIVKTMAATIRYCVRPISILAALPRLNVHHFDRHRRRPRILSADRLAADAWPAAQRQHYGADHGDEK